jgi:hypothetical protein
MNRRQSLGHSGLFLLELLFCILILLLCSTACIRLFAAAWQNRSDARAYNHIEELTTNFCEIFEGSDGTMDDILRFYETGCPEETSLLYYYDRSWNDAKQEDAVYTLTLTPSVSEKEKTLHLVFSGADDSILYELEVRYPRIQTEVS